MLDFFRRRCTEARQLSKCDCRYWGVRAFLNNGSVEPFGVCTESVYERGKRGGAESVRG